jgi:integrase/recombinase XerD
MNLESLFQQFVKERRYFKNTSERTIQYYHLCWSRFRKAVPDAQTIDKPTLNEFLLKLRESGIAPVTCNITIRGINSFLSWLFESGYTQEHFKLKQLRIEKKILKTFNDKHLKAILLWKPHDLVGWRLHALLCLLIDTGIRIEEALTLPISKVDYDNMLITVRGKGNKERIVPMSFELRKVLLRYQRMHPHSHALLFPTRDGGRLSYHNILRDFKNLAKELGIEGVRVSFHTLRHGFALNYIRNGGSPFHLKKAMGHSDLKTTLGYVELVTEDLQQEHTKTSILNRLR